MASGALRSRSAIVLFGVLALGVAACTGGEAEEASSAAPTAGVILNPEFREPVALSSVDGVLEVELTAVQSTTALNTVAEPVEGMLLFSWKLIRGESDGATSGANQYPGPTLVVNPGERLIVHAGNSLSGLTIPDLVDPMLTPAGEEVPLTPRILDAMPLNLHTHGLHVSPNLNSDNVLLEFEPGQANTYVYDIPSDHPQGLYWYHPHRHQITEPQVYRGLAGMLVVGRPEGDIPKVADNDIPVRIMALQGNFIPNRDLGMHQLAYTSWTQVISTWQAPEPGAVEAGTYEPVVAPVTFPNAPAGATFTTNWWAGPLTGENKRGAFQFMPQNLISFTSPEVDVPADPAYPDHLRDYQITVNGQFQPEWKAAPGQTEVWVIGNLGSQSYMNVAVRNTATGELVPLRVLATDGNPAPAVVGGNNGDGTTYLLPSASRVAIAVTMPEEGGLQLELPPVAGPTANHTQPLETDGVRYTSNGDGSIPRGVLGRVSIDPANVNWFDGFKSTPTQVLARMAPEGAPTTPVDFPLGEPLNATTDFLDLADAKVDVTRSFEIGGGFTPLASEEDPKGFLYMFDNSTWPTTPVIHPRLGSVEEWRFLNGNNDQHPMHVHVNDYEVVKLVNPVQGSDSGPLPYAVDNFNVPAPTLDANESALQPGQMWLRSTFTDYLGTFVIHCHRLDHEDNGLMMTINIIPEVSTIATAAMPAGGQGARVDVRDQADGRIIGSVVPFPESAALPSLDMADVDGDTILDLIAGQGPGGRPEVVAYSGAGPAPFTREIARFDAFEADFRGGVSVAGGIISGDPTKNNIIVASGPGRPNEIRVLSSDLPGGPGQAPAAIASFAPFSGDEGSVISAGLVTPGRISIVAAPVGSDRVSVYQFPLFSRVGDDASTGDADANLGQPVLVDEFEAFEDYDGPLSLATGWVAAREGGVESIVVGQASGSGAVRVLSWASRLTDESAMYVEHGHDGHSVSFAATVTFTPLEGAVAVATTSTTSGAHIIVTGLDEARSVADVYAVKRGDPDQTQLTVRLVETVAQSDGSMSVAGG